MKTCYITDCKWIKKDANGCTVHLNIDDCAFRSTFLRGIEAASSGPFSDRVIISTIKKDKLKFNVTLDELEKATKFAKESGESEFKTITVHVNNGNGIGAVIHVSKPRSNELIDITDVEAW